MWIYILVAGLALLSGYLIWLRLRERATPGASVKTDSKSPDKDVSEKDQKRPETDEAVIYELTAEDVPNIIKKESHVIIMVYSPACGFCRKMEPEFAEAAKKLQGHCAWARLNAQDFGDAARALGVDAYPTTLQFKDGNLVKPLPGAMDAQTLILQVQ